MSTALITGSGGLLGSELALQLLDRGETVIGVDIDRRAAFFGKEGSVRHVIDELIGKTGYVHSWSDICDGGKVDGLISRYKPLLVINCAAQPSHDYSCEHPREDFAVNAVGTLNVLESCRNYCPKAVVIQLSTNKVYGDAVNQCHLVESRQRIDFEYGGISETFRVLSKCIHSPYGISKLAADALAQEYASYYGMTVGVFRAGCITGERHGAVALHGFLAYLVKCAVKDVPYTIIGYGGKQVRDQIHASDLAAGILRYAEKPRAGEVYNVGGGKENSLSILEAVERIEKKLGKRMAIAHQEQPRRGDHVCYYSNNSLFESHYGKLVTISVDEIIDRLIAWWRTH